MHAEKQLPTEELFELYDFWTNFSSIIAGLFDVFFNPNTFLSLQFLCRSILHLRRVRSVLESLDSFCVKVSFRIDQIPSGPHYSAFLQVTASQYGDLFCR